jgi:hypothetical protein
MRIGSLRSSLPAFCSPNVHHYHYHSAEKNIVAVHQGLLLAGFASVNRIQYLTQETSLLGSLRGSERELDDRAFHASTVCLLTNHTKLAVFKGS